MDASQTPSLHDLEANTEYTVKLEEVKGYEQIQNRPAGDGAGAADHL